MFKTKLLEGEGPHGYKATSEDKNPYGIDGKRFSSFMTLITVSSWIHRFIKRLKRKKDFHWSLDFERDGRGKDTLEKEFSKPELQGCKHCFNREKEA